MVEMFACSETDYEEFIQNRFNYSKNSDFVDVLMNITSNSQKRWIDEGNATWQGKSSVNYVETFLLSGIGFTFNAFEADEVFNSQAVSEDFFRIQSERKSKVKVPWTTFFSSSNNFKISLNNNTHLIKERGAKCKDAGYVIHSSYDIPINIEDKKFTKLNFGTSMDILIKPEVIRSDESIKGMDFHHRKCYFVGEYQLKYFKFYSKSHCKLEILSESTFEKCGCSPFNYIRNKSMEICDVSRLPCVQVHETTVREGNFYRHCLPLCDSIIYEMEMVRTRVASNFSQSSDEEVTLNFRFKESEIVGLIKYRLLPPIDFLCIIGGILGLFAGVSCLTILETFYLMIIRPIVDVVRIFF